MESVLKPAASIAAETAGQAFRSYLGWSTRLEWEALPRHARTRTAMVLIDDLSAAFSALREPQVEQAQARLRQQAAGAGGAASLLVPGRPRLDVSSAAMGNGLAMGWNELDEGFRKAVCHAGLYVLPALLAVAEAEGATLRELLRALALGYETVARVARTWRFATIKIHPHALLAPVGAAAGVGYLRRLPDGDLLAALSCAATMGMVGPYSHALQGVLARNAWAPQAAVAGLNALEWTRCGIGGHASSPHDVYVGVLDAQEDLSALLPGDADGWAVESGYHKVNACCQYAHSVIEAAQSLLGEHPTLLGGDQVQAIEVEAHALAFALDDRRPATTLGAKFSVPHAVAATLVHGDGGAGSFDAASLRDPRIARLRDATSMRRFEEVRPWPEDRPARVTVTTVGGLRFTAECWSARGGPDRPLPEASLWEKWSVLSRPHAPAFVSTARRIVEAAKQAADAPSLERRWSSWLDDCLAQSSGDEALRRDPAGGNS